MRLAIVQAYLGPALHVGVEKPLDDEEGRLDGPNFTERQGWSGSPTEIV